MMTHTPEQSSKQSTPCQCDDLLPRCTEDVQWKIMLSKNIHSTSMTTAAVMCMYVCVYIQKHDRVRDSHSCRRCCLTFCSPTELSHHISSHHCSLTGRPSTTATATATATTATANAVTPSATKRRMYTIWYDRNWRVVGLVYRTSPNRILTKTETRK